MCVVANYLWKNGEYAYCYELVQTRGNEAVGHDPKTIATYLRIQAAAACRDQQFEISARLGHAATSINENALNNHAPNWELACMILYPIIEQSKGLA